MGASPKLLLTIALLGCGSVKVTPDGATSPQITSFTADPPAIAVGGTTNLTAIFSGGTGFINNGGGPVTSSVAVAMSPTVPTTYVLTVTADDGTTATQSVGVSIVDIAVTSLADAGPGTLRQAIIDVAGGHQTIGIVVPGTIQLASPLPALTGNVTIAGAAATDVSINGATGVRIFYIDGNVTLRNLVLTDGSALGGAGAVDALAGGGGGGGAAMGGAVFVNAGTVAIDRVQFLKNVASGGAGAGATSNNITSPGGGGGGFDNDAMNQIGGSSGLLGGAGGGNGGNGGLVAPAGGAGAFGCGGGGGGNGNGSAGGAGGRGGFGGGGGGGGGGNTNGPGGPGGMFGGAGAMRFGAGGGGGGAGLGGALFVRSGTVQLTGCTFMQNAANRGAGGVPYGDPTAAGQPGFGKGGAIFVSTGAIVSNTGATFMSNFADDAGTLGTDNEDVFGVVN